MAAEADEAFEKAIRESQGIDGHRVKMEFDGGSWRLKLICPESGCKPATQCAFCAADLTEPDSKRCYDCRGVNPDQSTCWIQGWFDDCPEEYVQGAIEFPVEVEWDTDHPIIHIRPEEAQDASH